MARFTPRARSGTALLSTVLWTVVFLSGFAEAGDRGLIVHEWGTFTALQDEQGRELPGINVDDEPVPEFVHNLSPFVLSPTLLTRYHWRYRMKSVPRRHPHVTLRLETPVVYFYPPEGAGKSLTVDVDVRFRGGWLSEFYPHAQAQAPGLEGGRFRFGDLTPKTLSSLTWKDLQIGTDVPGPETDAHVWIAPRQVRSTPVINTRGESEQYLFYRGVAHVRAPLRVSTDRYREELTLRGNFDEVLRVRRSRIDALWLVDVRPDGRVAYRRVGPLEVGASTEEVLAVVPSDFAESEFAAENLQRLHEDMHGALVRAGLYDDEARAMLSTWKRAYFTSPGHRLFFLVPRSWTDHYLPLEVSREADIVRVMMGRIELVTARHREVLRALSEGPISDGQWVRKIPRGEPRELFHAGRGDIARFGVEIPADYRKYMDLGRFRNALVLAQERQEPTPSLTQFIDVYGLGPYRWQPQTARAGDTPRAATPAAEPPRVRPPVDLRASRESGSRGSGGRSPPRPR
ncbi:MAG: hypothetical protein O7J95_15930 [Planctomycetota bacterium]|nr:hypothetical protein [Planctomycetota bacterium]